MSFVLSYLSIGLMSSGSFLQWLPGPFAEPELMAQKLSVYEHGLAYFPLNALHSFQIVATQTMPHEGQKE